MKKHEHAPPVEPDSKPTHDEVAKAAYAISQHEGHSPGHARQDWLEAEAQLRDADPDPPRADGHDDSHDHQDHHAHMAADFRKDSNNKHKRNKIMNTTKSEAKDPICGMTVDTATALHTERDGEIFYFCSGHCREKFLSAPAGTKPDGKSGGCCCG